MRNEHLADPTPPPHYGQGRGGSRKEFFFLSPALHPPDRPSPHGADMANHGLGRETRERRITICQRYKIAFANPHKLTVI